MLLNAEKLIKKVRRHVLDTAGQQQGNTWQDADILAVMNEEQEGLIAKVIEASEDFFGALKNITTQADVGEYPLFDGFLLLRLVEFGGDGSANPVFTQAMESRLIEGAQGVAGIAAPSESQFYYALWDESLHIQPVPTTGQANYGRMWFIREPGPLLYENPASVPDAQNLVLSAGEAPYESDIMIGTFVDIVSGPGVGQRRKIAAWDGPNKKATMDIGFTTPPTTASKIATISRIPRLYQALLSMGGAIRLMVDTKEDARGLGALYADRMDDFMDFIEKRTYAQRGMIPFDPDDTE